MNERDRYWDSWFAAIERQEVAIEAMYASILASGYEMIDANQKTFGLTISDSEV